MFLQTKLCSICQVEPGTVTTRREIPLWFIACTIKNFWHFHLFIILCLIIMKDEGTEVYKLVKIKPWNVSKSQSVCFSYNKKCAVSLDLHSLSAHTSMYNRCFYVTLLCDDIILTLRCHKLQLVAKFPPITNHNSAVSPNFMGIPNQWISWLY